jgi:uncharacterized protein YjbJ (UPF0337 family)
MNAKMKQVTGWFRQVAGSLSGNKRLEREGRADRRFGEVGGRLSRAKGGANKTIEKVANAVKGAVANGRNVRRRKQG